MKKLENLKSEIENLFKKNGFDENIEFRELSFNIT